MRSTARRRRARRSRASGRRLSTWTSARPSSSSSRADARGATAWCCPRSCRRVTGSPSRRSRSTSTSDSAGTHRLEDRRRERGDPARRGTAERVPGRIYRSTVFTSPASLAPELFINYRNVECEFAFRLRTALPPRDAEYREDEVAAAIECLMPTLEIGDTVFEDWYGSSGSSARASTTAVAPPSCAASRSRSWRELDLPERAHGDQPQRPVHQRGLRARRDGPPADVADLAGELARRRTAGGWTRARSSARVRARDTASARPATACPSTSAGSAP